MTEEELELETTEKVWRFLLKFKEEHDGNHPTVRAIATAVGLKSPSSALHQLRKLQGFGYIYKRDNCWCVRGATWNRPPAHWRDK